jgi:hypothetical protein
MVVLLSVLLVVKTPLAWLAAVGVGLAVWWGRRAQLAYWMPVAFAAGILLPSMTSHVNIGLAAHPAIFTGTRGACRIGLLRLLERAPSAKWAGPLASVLVLWLAVSGALQHPDYLSYFNEIAGSSPERIVVDSDLDWGPEYRPPPTPLKQLGAAQVAFGDVNLHSNHLMVWPGLPRVTNLDAFRPVEAGRRSALQCGCCGSMARLSRPACATLVGILSPRGKSGLAVALLCSARLTAAISASELGVSGCAVANPGCIRLSAG